MDIEKSSVVEAPISKLWDLVENPDEAFARARGDAQTSKLGDGVYQLKVPVKLGLFKLNVTVNAKFFNKRPPVYSDLEFNAKLPGTKVEGSGCIEMEELGPNRTKVQIKVSGGSGGAVSKLLGGGKSEGLVDGLIKSMESQATGG